MKMILSCFPILMLYMNEELKTTTLTKSFVRAKEQAPRKDEVYISHSCRCIECTEFCLFILNRLSTFSNCCHALLGRNI